MSLSSFSTSELLLIITMGIASLIVVVTTVRTIRLKRKGDRLLREAMEAHLRQLQEPGDLAKDGKEKARVRVEDLTIEDDFQSEEENICAICIEPLKGSVAYGSCKHQMHTDCLRAWLAKDVYSTCPTCRARYRDLITDKGNDAAVVDSVN